MKNTDMLEWMNDLDVKYLTEACPPTIRQHRAKRRLMTILIAAAVAAVCMAAAAAVYAGGSASPALFDKTGSVVPHSEKSFSVNKNGQTYGTAGDKMYDDDLPDLISVIGDHGVHGYVTKEDYLDDDGITCPEEAAAYMEAKANGEIPVKVWTVYASDGVTVVDTFTLGSK